MTFNTNIPDKLPLHIYHPERVIRQAGAIDPVTGTPLNAKDIASLGKALAIQVEIALRSGALATFVVQKPDVCDDPSERWKQPGYY